MASCKFEGGKCKGGTEAKAFFMHDEKEQRLSHEHTNEHIDKSKTPLNTSMYGLSYKEVCEKYDARIDELDRTTNKNTRKDRVTMQCVEVPVPKDLPRDKYPLFFERVAQIMCEQYGEENFLDGYVHYDEEHEFLNPDTNEMEMSRVHCHYNFVPEVEGQLNGKVFSGRANINKLNNSVHKMCQQEFGVKFMDGSKKKGKKSVEQLKAMSAQAYADKMNEADEVIISCAEDYSQKCDELELARREQEEDLDSERADVWLERKQNARDSEKNARDREKLEADQQQFETRVSAEVERRLDRRERAEQVSSSVQTTKPSRRLPELGF